MSVWDQIEEKCNQHGYMSGVDRQSDRVKDTGEVFTPTALVLELCRKLIDKNPDSFVAGKTILDPACGDGQFLVAAKWIKVLLHGMSEEEAVKDIYGVDIMRDNVDLCRKRLGGGNIVMGNTLEPYVRLEEQTEEENLLMRDWFAQETDLESFFV
jgi:2-polyprenyl-3-methyl-5-hydroxy-6-metoxy-1,4-benzoquinol methylase